MSWPSSRVNAQDFDRGILAFEKAAAARNRPASSESGDKMGDLALGLPPDFRPGGAEMRVGIGLVRVLVKEDKPGLFRRRLPRRRDRPLRSPGSRAKRIVQFPHLGAEKPQNGALFQRNRGRKRRTQGISFGVADHGEAEAGVARRGLDQLLPRRQPSAGFGVPDQVGRDPVLDRAEGIVPFELGVDPGVVEGYDAVESDQGGRIVFARHQTEDRIVDAGGVITCHFG